MSNLILEVSSAPVSDQQQTIQQMYRWSNLAQETSQKLLLLQKQAQQIQPIVNALNQETQRLEHAIMSDEDIRSESLSAFDPVCVATADRFTQVAQETVDLTRQSAQRSLMLVSLSQKALQQYHSLKSFVG